MMIGEFLAVELAPGVLARIAGVVRYAAEFADAAAPTSTQGRARVELVRGDRRDRAGRGRRRRPGPSGRTPRGRTSRSTRKPSTERPRLVAALYAATFPKAKEAKPAAGAAAPTAAEEEARLVEAMPLRPEDVPSLLSARHAAARDALVAAGIEPARLFTVQGGERATKEPGSRVYFTVR